MNSLATRKQLLIAESELNRAQLFQEWQEVKLEAHALTARASEIKSLLASAIALVAGLTAWTQKKKAATASQPAWWQTLVNGVGLVSGLGSDFRSARRK